MDFAQIFKDFAQVLNESKLLGLCLHPCTPTSYTTVPIHSHTEVTIVTRYLRLSVSCDVLRKGHPNYNPQAKSARKVISSSPCRHFVKNEFFTKNVLIW